MNRKIIFWTLTIMSILLFGCNNTSEQSNSNSENNVSMLSDSLKHHIEAQDSLYKELILKVDTITTKLNSEKRDMAMLKSSVEDKKSQSRILVIISIIIGCLALFVALVVAWCTRLHLEKKDVVATINDQLRKVGLDKETRDRILKSINNHGSVNNSLVNDNVKLLEKRIEKLEEKISKMKSISIEKRNELPSIPQQSLDIQEEKLTFSTRHLYARINSDIYFPQVFESNQDDTCVFIIDLITDNSGEFDIISLEKIQQRNHWESVIHYTGDCTVSEAKTAKTIEKGKCEISDRTWKVVKKLEIAIS